VDRIVATTRAGLGWVDGDDLCWGGVPAHERDGYRKIGAITGARGAPDRPPRALFRL